MYYKEKIINGILCCRGVPNGEWRPIDYETIVKRLIVAEDKLQRMYQECLR